jgi:hypothetical protein
MEGKRLKVCVGQNASETSEISVNNGLHPFEFDSETVSARVVVRIKETSQELSILSHADIESLNESIRYFDRKSRLFSFQIELRFKNAYSGDDVLFGVQMTSPFQKVPPGLSLITRFIEMLDPAISMDLICDRPSSFSPLLCAVNAVNIQTAPPAMGQPIPVIFVQQNQHSETQPVKSMGMATMNYGRSVDSLIGPHKYYGSELIEEKNFLLCKNRREMTSNERKVLI